MKKYLLVFFLTVASLSIFSQTTPWINPGATWFYKWWGPSQLGNDKIEYTHDTILYGKTCEILKTTRYYFTGPPIQVWENYTYNNGDTVFYLLDTAFEVLYNFGSLTGNTWDLGVDTNYDYCSRSIVKVDSISSLIISSNPHRILYTSDSANSCVGLANYPIIEHIGSMEYLFPLPRHCGSGVIDFYMFSFSCFSDSLENYSVVAQEECQNPYHVGIIKQEKISDEVAIFPNPASNQINVNWNNTDYCTISVYNSLGKLILEKSTDSLTNNTISISDLDPGVYLISMKNEDGTIAVRRFVKNNF